MFEEIDGDEGEDVGGGAFDLVAGVFLCGLVADELAVLLDVFVAGGLLLHQRNKIQMVISIFILILG